MCVDFKAHILFIFMGFSMFEYDQIPMFHNKE